MSDDALALALLTDAVCYSMWVALLFSLAKLAPAFNRWTKARSSADMLVAPVRTTGPVTADAVLLWLGMAVGTTGLSGALASLLPTSGMVSATTWTIMIATGCGLVIPPNPLPRFHDATPKDGRKR